MSFENCALLIRLLRLVTTLTISHCYTGYRQLELHGSGNSPEADNILLFQDRKPKLYMNVTIGCATELKKSLSTGSSLSSTLC